MRTATTRCATENENAVIIDRASATICGADEHRETKTTTTTTTGVRLRETLG
jgi:hypothetical protein